MISKSCKALAIGAALMLSAAGCTDLTVEPKSTVTEANVFNDPGSYKAFARLSSIQEEEGVPSAEEMIRQLVIGQETVVRTAREVFPTVEKASDEPTADLLTQRMQIHEKNAWMLRSMLE